MDSKISSAGVSISSCVDPLASSPGSAKGGSAQDGPSFLLPQKAAVSLPGSGPLSFTGGIALDKASSASSSNSIPISDLGRITEGIDPSAASLDPVISYSALLGGGPLFSPDYAVPEAQAFRAPFEMASSAFPRIGLLGADSEFALPPPRSRATSTLPVVPLAPGSAHSYGSGSDPFPVLRPEVGSLLGSPAVLQVPSVPRSELDLTDRVFPPLAPRAGVSKSKSKLSSSFADSANVPGILPDDAPSSPNEFVMAPNSGKPSWSSISTSGKVSNSYQLSSHPPVASPVIPPNASLCPARGAAADPMPSTSSWASLLKEKSSSFFLLLLPFFLSFYLILLILAYHAYS